MHTTEQNVIGDKARAVIDLYLALPVGARPSCPYFNNKRRKTRSQLRVLKGKGSPQEIVEEAKILAKYGRVDIDSLSAVKLKEFLVAQDLGVDCSGFAYHILDAIAHERAHKGIRNLVKSNRTGFVGSLIARLRPAENMGVATFANDRNSLAIKASEARPGDMIVFIGTGKDNLYNHLLVVTATDGANISYAHSYAWPSDGATGHGVREGSITLKGDNLLDALWTEKNASGRDNYTFESARQAKGLSVRRLRFLL